MYRKKEENGPSMWILCCWTFYVYSLHLLQHTYFDLEPAIHIWTGITVFLGLLFFSLISL